MKALFSTNGAIYKIMAIIYQLIILNLLWCLASIPFVTIGASTTALFYVVGKIVRKEEVHEVRDFIKGFRDNFRQGTCIWLILCAAYMVIFTNLSFLERYNSFGGLMLAVQIPVLFQVAVVTVFVFPLLSRFESNTIGIIKASWILGVKHIFSSLASLAAVAALVVLVMVLPSLFLMVFASSAAMAVYLIVNRIMEKYCIGAA